MGGWKRSAVGKSSKEAMTGLWSELRKEGQLCEWVGGWVGGWRRTRRFE